MLTLVGKHVDRLCDEQIAVGYAEGGVWQSDGAEGRTVKGAVVLRNHDNRWPECRRTSLRC